MFPARYTVMWESYDPTATDDRGNPVDGWLAPQPRKVYGWGPPKSREPRNNGVSTLVVDQQLLVPPSWSSTENDRVTLAGVVYQQEGLVEDYNHGPFGWQPGSVVNLRRVK